MTDREALIEAFYRDVFGHNGAEGWADQIIVGLLKRGFVIVPSNRAAADADSFRRSATQVARSIGKVVRSEMNRGRA